MAVDFRKLKQRLSHFAEELAPEPRGEATFVGGVKTAIPHIEVIDFDELRQALAEAMAVLTAAAKQNDDTAVVRDWLAARIAALRRARQAFLREGHAPINPVEEDMPLPTLLRCFEDETARWRAATAEGSCRAGRNGGRGHKEYHEFKS